MKILKRTICLLLAALCVFAAGCRRNAPEETTEYAYSFTPATQAQEESTQEPAAAAAEPTTAAEATTAGLTTAAPTTAAPTTAAPTAAAPTTAAPTTAAPTTAAPTTAAPTTAAPTTAAPTTAPPTTAASQLVCTVEIRCDTVLRNMDSLKKNKAAFVPDNGCILSKTAAAFSDGDTVFDVVRRVCAENACDANCPYCRGGIQLEYTYTPGLNTYYIEGVHQLYEKDCGMYSGWMYSVNGAFPNVGVSEYAVSAGDEIVFAYTCDMGEDIGNHY